MKTIKTTAKTLGAPKLTASTSGRTLSVTTYKTALSAMKQAIRKDDHGDVCKSIERKK